MMTERPNRVNEIVNEALRVDPADCEVWGHKACCDNDDLWAEAGRLLRSDETVGREELLDLPDCALSETGSWRRSGGCQPPHAPTPKIDMRAGLFAESGKFEGAREIGQYRLHQQVGAGAMGEVYLAEHQLLKRPCALKLIRPDIAGDPAALALFEREVRVTATLSHPNTVEIYDYGRTSDGTYYYVMEFLPGLSLAELVERHGPLPPGRVVHLLRQVCQALSEAHAKGLIHRDIKPSNIIAARRGGMDDVAKLLDFGLVRPVTAELHADTSTEGRILGTPLFTSPEQARGDRELDRRSDIYSLGAVAYHLLTGRPPFHGTGGIAVLVAHARAPVVPPSKILLGIPLDLERVVVRCLAKAAADRFADAESLERALGACACSEEWDQEHATRWWRNAGHISSSHWSSI
jgi:serine/threonine protein kinase